MGWTSCCDGGGASRLRAANSITVTICSRDKWNQSIISLIEAPASRFSKTMETGIRVSLNTHAPLTLPGTLSTAGHCDQSRVDSPCRYPPFYRKPCTTDREQRDLKKNSLCPVHSGRLAGIFMKETHHDGVLSAIEGIPEATIGRASAGIVGRGGYFR